MYVPGPPRVGVKLKKKMLGIVLYGFRYSVCRILFSFIVPSRKTHVGSK